jgi:branched-chain amino acid transport system substrate-binding protein
MRYRGSNRGGLTAVIGCAAVAALAVAGCGGDDSSSGSASSGGGGGGSKTLTVYSSLPLQGAARPQSAKLVNGIKLAVQQAGGKAGPYSIKYESLDDSTPQAGTWTPEATSANARKAAQDDNAVAYIGEFNSGATAVSLPLLNDGGLAMVSPANSAVGLTTNGPGAEPGEPDKYYPSGDRNYARIVPTDALQGAGMAQLMKEKGCTAAWISNDKEVYGAGLAKNIHTAADSIGLKVAGDEGFDSKAANYRSLGQKIHSAGADCFAYAGNTANNAVQLFKDVAVANPDTKAMLGSDAVAEPAFTDPKEGGLPASVAKRVTVLAVGLAPKDYPPAGQEFFKAYEQKFNDKEPGQYAIYGYEAMSLVIDAIKRAGDQGADRKAVLDQIFATKDRDSVVGKYSIDDNGDTTQRNYGVYEIVDGTLKYTEPLEAPSIK